MRQTLDNAGAPLATVTYDPWGTPQGNAISPFGFTGELQDAQGLTYLRARWYTPGAGTFTSARWRSDESNPEVPLSNHVYVYGLNNPVLYTDAPGTCSGPGCGKDGSSTNEAFRVACIARGGAWDPVLNFCREGLGGPPPSEPERPKPPAPANPPLVDPLLPVPMVGVGGMVLPRPGSDQEEALLKAGLCTALTLSALEALTRGLESIRDSVQTRRQDWIYFVHGTTTSLWGDATTISSTAGVGDFGLGFYTFEDSRWGRESAATWAKRKARTQGGTAILVRVRIERQTFNALIREDVPDVALDTAYQLLYPRGLTGKELVVGPVGRNGPGGARVADKSLPLQYKFEGSGVLKLTFDSIISAP